MAYIGKPPVNGFHSKQSLTTDGSTTTFTLDYTVADETSLIVSVGGVLQEPKVAFNLAGAGTQITFTAAPASTDTAYIQFLGQAIVQNLLDVNGGEFILDANGNTSLTADTDDEIDIKVGGTDRSTIKATGYHNVDSVKFVAGTGDDMQMYHDGTNSYLTNSQGALKVATETSGIAITIGHTTSEVTVGDNLTVTGNLTVGGSTSFGDFDITNVGSIALDTITNDGTDITLDSSGDIILDAGGNTVFLKDSGTTFGSLDNSSGELIIKSGSTPTTAITFSGANTTLAGTLGVGAVTSTGVVTGTTVEATGDTSAGDNAAVGYTSAEGLILTGQGSTNDVTIKNDADADVISIPTGATNVTVAGVVTATGFTIGSAAITEAELEILDGANVTTAELNLLDGSAKSTSSITVADADALLVIDGNTTKQIPASDIKTYASGSSATKGFAIAAAIVFG